MVTNLGGRANADVKPKLEAKAEQRELQGADLMRDEIQARAMRQQDQRMKDAIQEAAELTGLDASQVQQIMMIYGISANQIISLPDEARNAAIERGKTLEAIASETAQNQQALEILEVQDRQELEAKMQNSIAVEAGVEILLANNPQEKDTIKNNYAKELEDRGVNKETAQKLVNEAEQAAQNIIRNQGENCGGDDRDDRVAMVEGKPNPKGVDPSAAATVGKPPVPEAGVSV